MFNKLAVMVLAAAVLGTNAQSSSSSALGAIPSGITACSLQCISQSLSAGGCSNIADLQCLCTSQAFEDATRQCLQNSCPDDISAATSAQQSQCASISSSAASAGSSSASASSEASRSASATSAASSASGRSASASSALSSAVSGASSIISKASSEFASATSANASATGNNNGAAPINTGGILGLAVAALGVLAGAGFVL
ncbi:hypothetical protein QCA50_008419 [Cerrena zonata]|uniref:CFEM domain-containing protein n=1 Tax=Cerrena zonata TaxID=2478898 RepID=A0AAW0G8W8_9APHY